VIASISVVIASISVVIASISVKIAPNFAVNQSYFP
jgi:hypothetical protein